MTRQSHGTHTHGEKLDMFVTHVMLLHGGDSLTLFSICISFFIHFIFIIFIIRKVFFTFDCVVIHDSEV